MSRYTCVNSNGQVSPRILAKLEGKEKADAFEKCMIGVFNRCAALEDAMEEYEDMCSMGLKTVAKALLIAKLEIEMDKCSE